MFEKQRGRYVQKKQIGGARITAPPIIVRPTLIGKTLVLLLLVIKSFLNLAGRIEWPR